MGIVLGVTPKPPAGGVLHPYSYIRMTKEPQMLKGELGENRAATEDKPLTYGAYLRVPELLRLQTPLKEPPEHDEMLFVIVQQIQELWFKQMLYELRAIIDAVEGGALTDAARLLTRTNRILKVVANEVAILETMLPQDFQRFRY